MMRAGGKGIDIEGAENRTGVALPQEMPSWPVHQSTKPPDCHEPQTTKLPDAKSFEQQGNVMERSTFILFVAGQEWKEFQKNNFGHQWNTTLF